MLYNSLTFDFLDIRYKLNCSDQINSIHIVFCSFVATDCQHRDFGKGSTVCVCTTDHCDDLKPLVKTQKGVITEYSTSKQGDRFAKSEGKFSKNPLNQNAEITVEIGRDQKYQKIVGFGGAFTDSTGLNIAKLPKQLQERLIKDYFANDGIEYSIGRVPIGGSDFSTRPYTYDDHPNDDSLSKFALQHEDFNYKVCIAKSTIHLFMINCLRFLLFKWHKKLAHIMSS